MTIINTPALQDYHTKREFVLKHKIERKSVWDLRGVSPALGKHANLAEFYGNLIVDYVFYFEACLVHDYLFQGKTMKDPNFLERNGEITLADKVDDPTRYIMTLWIQAQDMLFRSYSRENIVRANKWRSFPTKEIPDFLRISEDHRLNLVAAYKDVFMVSFAFLVKDLELKIDTESDLDKWLPILRNTYTKVIDRSREVAKDVGVIQRKKEELWELFEVEEFLIDGLRLFI